MENINDYMPLSPDWNKERLEKLKELFPDLFTNEGLLNIDELKKVIDPQSVTETERYEFRWFGKSAAKRNAFTPSNATLQFDEKRSVNPNESENLIIEGENLEVLKLLSNSYREKIKCIYIDPPYNTGGDFVYSDNYNEDKKPYWEQTGVTENGVKIDTNNDTNGRFHSNWLDMMFSRLLIARQLLKEDGVIFISIDDNEVHNLRKLCDEVFGEENFLDCIIWKKRYGGGAKEKFLVTVHEYVLLYAKNLDEINPIFIPNNQEAIDRYYKSKDENFELRGPYRTHPLEATKSMGDRKNLIFPIPGPDKNEIFPKRQWLWSRDTVEKALKKNEIAFLKDKDGNWSAHSKQYLKNEKGEIREIKAFSLIDDIFTQHGTNEIIDIFGNAQIFSFPKPSSFIKKLLQIGCENSEDIVLDFFGGSGSTGHAISLMNNEDGGNRKYILVQIPEATDENGEAYKAGYKKISDITIERNKRVIEKIIEEKKSQAPDLFTNGHKEDAIRDLGFKVFKLVKSTFPRVEFAPDTEKTDEENVELLKKYIAEKEAQLITAFNRDELIAEILLKNGFNLNYKIEKQPQFIKNDIFLAADGEKETLICLDYVLDQETVTYFKTHTTTKFICLERALDTTKKYSLKHYMGNMFKAF
jgi:adenine-specific DNA-methyltransferase